MVKLLHTADLHLGCSFGGVSRDTAGILAARQREILPRLGRLAREQGCAALLLAGDLFEGNIPDGLLRETMGQLESMRLPVFIAPGNHDHMGGDSPYRRGLWPSNVYVFAQPRMESVALKEHDLRIWGAGFTSMDCPGLLEGFHATGQETWQVGLLHADPLSPASPHCPVTRAQVRDSGLHYLALGHIHKAGRFSSGGTLCAWPGCPMGTGFDETGIKGALVVELREQEPCLQFFDLRLGQFHALEVPLGNDPREDILNALPPETRQDVYRLILTGTAEKPDLTALQESLKESFLELQLEDRTVRPRELWQEAGQDSLEGRFMARLKQEAENAPTEQARQRLLLASKIARMILDGQEVKLP